MPAVSFIFLTKNNKKHQRFIAKAQNCKYSFCNDTFNLISRKETAHPKCALRQKCVGDFIN